MTQDPPAPKRFTALQIMGGVIIASLLMGFFAGLTRVWLGEESGNAITAIGALIALALGCATMLPYWRRLDEAAQEAHKDAWLWGGVVGYTLAAAYASLLFILPNMPVLDLVGLEPHEAMATGIILTILAQALCYGVAWGIWWMRKR